jgi:hypothetical protein
MHVVEPRHPEPQRSSAQQRRPLRALVVGQLAHAVVRPDHRLHAVAIEGAVAVGDAPVVDRDREVVREVVGRREAEIDDARDARTREEHVVAEEIAVDRPLRQRRLAEPGLEAHLVGEEFVLRRGDEGPHRPRCLTPPCGAAAIGQARPVGLRREMQPRECRTDRGARVNGRRIEGCTLDAHDETRGTTVEMREQRAGTVGNRCRHVDAGARQMRHEIEVEGKILGRKSLVERQHVAPALGRHEIIRVFDTRGDRRVLDERAHRIAREPGIEFVGGDGRIDGHSTHAGATRAAFPKRGLLKTNQRWMEKTAARRAALPDALAPACARRRTEPTSAPSAWNRGCHA